MRSAILLLLLGCSPLRSPQSGDAGDAGLHLDGGPVGGLDGGSATGQDAGVDAGSAPGWELLLRDEFDDPVQSPFVPGYAELPRALFPEDGSRWTQIQNTHPQINTMRLAALEGRRFLASFAAGQNMGVASKMDVGRSGGLSFQAGDLVRIKAVLRLEGPSPFGDHTLIGLEDTDDLFLEGCSPGAGLRIRTDAQGRLALDRGELPGFEGPKGQLELRLSTQRSETVLPVGRWFEVEALLKLGVQVARSTSAPIDESVTETDTAWVELRVNGTLVLRARGSNFLDRQAVEAALLQEAPNTPYSWADKALDFDSFQVGATNNRSGLDGEVWVDRVELARLRRR